MANLQTSQSTTLIRLPEVLARTGLSKATLLRAVAESRFPRPSKFGRCSLWSSDDVAAWIEQRVAAARGGVA